MAGVADGKSVCAVYASTQTNASVISAPAAGYALVIHYVNVSNGAVAGEHKLLDGSGGTVLFDAFLAINSPVTVQCQRAPIVLTAATALCYTSVTSTTSRITIGYSIEKV
jgi:hypothetical protein